MTKKDYILLARVIARCTHTDEDSEPRLPRDLFVEELAGELQRLRPTFNPEKFRLACRGIK